MVNVSSPINTLTLLRYHPPFTNTRTKQLGQRLPGTTKSVSTFLTISAFDPSPIIRTLVDQESSADILFTPAFDKLGLDKKELKAYPDTLFELGDTTINPLGFIYLHTTFGKEAKSKTLSIEFIIVDVASAYNALIGKTTLNRLGTVVYTPHICMKLPTPEGIDTIRGDQKLARKCYNESLNLRGKGKEVNTIELKGVRVKEELRPQPGGKTEEVQIGQEVGKNTNIGANLTEGLKQKLTQLLQQNSYLFAWKASDMPGIDPELMSHRLAVHPGSRPVQQRKRKLGSKRAQVVKEQV
ncbi:uncharacterized protein [Arachis hypogaea]|uniref:uncharacterized protein n=1 Tax=Arachis hypogaea TaxID=3818 RepID=UPI003B21FBBB